MTMDDNIDIDVCMGCGRYHGCTPTLVDQWRRLYRPKEREVMPQLCFNCLIQHAPISSQPQRIEHEGLELVRKVRATRIIVNRIQAWRAANAPVPVVHDPAKVVGGVQSHAHVGRRTKRK